MCLTDVINMDAEWKARLGEMNSERLKTFQPNTTRKFLALRVRFLVVAS
jgi:hypothetical protein